MRNIVFFDGNFRIYDCISISLFKILEKNDLINLPNDLVIKCFFIYISPKQTGYVIIIDDIFYYCFEIYDINMITHKINYTKNIKRKIFI
jgi:hypothetical protein